MKNKNDRERSAPENWLPLLNERCDIDLAFQALEGWEHFHTDTNRGRLRSLQLRPSEAWEFFRKAEDRAGEYSLSRQNMLRRFCLKFYRFENALIQESDPDTADPSLTESCLKAVLRDDNSDADLAKQLRSYCRGMYLLHRQRFGEAKKLFLRLLDQSRDHATDDRTVFHLAAAVAARCMKDKPVADLQFEYASLSIPVLDSKFNMGLYGGIAAALLRIWNREGEAAEWDAFLIHLKIPPKTADLFRERSRRIVERTKSLKRIFLF